MRAEGNSVYEQNISSFGLQECLQILTSHSTMCWNSRHSARKSKPEMRTESRTLQQSTLISCKKQSALNVPLFNSSGQ